MKIPLLQYWKLLVNYLRPQRGRVILLAVLLLATLSLQLINPQILRYFIDGATTGGGVDKLLPPALLFISSAIFTQVLAVLAAYTSQNVGWTATNALRVDLTEHCLRLDMPFHNDHTPGQLIERIDGDITAMANFFSQFIIQIVGNLLLLAGILTVLWFEDWRVGLGLTVFAVIALYALIKMRSISLPRLTEESKAKAHLYGYLEERLGGTEDIRSSGATGHVMNGLLGSVHEVMRRGIKTGVTIYGTWVIINSLFTTSYVIIFLLGAYMFGNGMITLGTVYLFFQYTEMLRAPLEQMTRQLQDLQKAGAGITRVQQLYTVHPTIVDGKGKTIPDGALSVDFDHVNFSYNGEETILQDLNFRLEPGKVLGLLGRTGSGKTTTSRLLFRLYEVSAGVISLGGVDIRDAKLSNLRQRVAMVTQEVQIFHATLRDNLTLFNPLIKDERILEVLRELELWEWYSGLKQGLDTPLKGSGSGISAGEAQLLAFARVFLEEPGLVILDEASSRLDPATERLIERAVDKLLENRTAIIIAHRLGTVQRADEIMILDSGRVIEHAPRQQLVSDTNSRFYQLLQTGIEEALA